MIKPPSRTILFAACLLAGAASPASADLVVLQYHHVSDSTPPSTSTSVSLFQDQLDLIEKLGLEVVPLKSGTQAALAGKLYEKQQIAITFDDAYESVYQTAAPLLDAKGYPYTVFVNTDAIGRKDFMTWNQLEEFRDDSQVTIANHSKDHNHMVRRPDESREAWRERTQVSLDDAQNALNKKLGTNAPLFAYPYGEFSKPLEAMLADRSWIAYGQQSGAIGQTSNNTGLPRFPMANTYGKIENLETKLTSKAFPVDAKHLPDAVISENPPTLTFPLPESMAANQLNCFASGQGPVSFELNKEGQVAVKAPEPFNSRRFRYNCTYPAGDGNFYWLSQQWLDLSQPEN